MTLPERSIQIARTYLGAREVPPRSNRGEEIDRFIRVGGGLTPEGHHYAWCASFVSDVVIEAYTRRDGVTLDFVGPPLFRSSPAALGLLYHNPSLRIAEPTANCIFVINHGDGKGHTGFVTRVVIDVGGIRPETILETIEGNTGPGPAAPAQDREGDGVYERRDRRVGECMGFLRIG